MTCRSQNPAWRAAVRAARPFLLVKAASVSCMKRRIPVALRLISLATSEMGHGRPCRASRRCGGFTPESGPAGGGPRLRPWAITRRQPPSGHARNRCSLFENSPAGRAEVSGSKGSGDAIGGRSNPKINLTLGRRTRSIAWRSPVSPRGTP